MNGHYEYPSELLKITEIGPWKIKCRLPANQSTSLGIIGPFGEDTSNEDLTEALKEAGFNGAVAEQIFKGKEKIKTSMFKVIFYSKSLPSYVRIGYQQYIYILENRGSATNANDLGTVLHSAGLLLAVLYAVAPTPAMSVTKPLYKIAATMVETIQPIMEDTQK
ncbi:hypothetical protein FHG87_025680 [Trinorchestia longiramus]|nr:hypothetical protein FHG87_025680 [Trinorchestia longiramus]